MSTEDMSSNYKYQLDIGGWLTLENVYFLMSIEEIDPQVSFNEYVLGRINWSWFLRKALSQ
jgi:hypothetical protein